MGKQFVIIAPYSRVSMPDGKTYDAGDTVVLSDLDYGLLTPGMRRTFVVDDVEDVEDPSDPTHPRLIIVSETPPEDTTAVWVDISQ